MGLFKKTKKHVDERVVSTQNKIYKEAYIIAMVLSFISAVVKSFIYGFSILLITAELVIMIVPALYYGVKSVYLGLYADEVELQTRISKFPMSGKKLILGLGVGIAISIFLGVRSSMIYGSDTNYIWYFIIVFFVVLILYIPCFAGLVALRQVLAKKFRKE